MKNVIVFEERATKRDKNLASTIDSTFNGLIFDKYFA